MMLADFHVHSNFSDGKLTIPEVVDLYGQREFGAIAITDHIGETSTVIGKAAGHLGLCLTEATFPIYREILKSEAERAWEQYKMIVIPGMELSKNSISNHRSAHIVALGISEYLSANEDVAVLARNIRNRGGLAIAAHPVSSGKFEKQTFHLWDRREELRDAFDAWEVASGEILFPEVQKTDLPKIASSDLHMGRHMTSWKTILNCERNDQAILSAIKRQKVNFYFYQDFFGNQVKKLKKRESNDRDRHYGYTLQWEIPSTGEGIGIG